MVCWAPLQLKGSVMERNIMWTPWSDLGLEHLHLQQQDGNILAPEMELLTDRQRYTPLESFAHGGLYRYESLESNFIAELPVDSDGLVIDYPSLFRSVWRSDVNS